MAALESLMLRKAVVDRVLNGDGRASREHRRAAFDNKQVVPEPVRVLVDKIAHHAYKVVDDDIAAAKAAGVSEDELFELVVCAAIGQATRQYDSAGAVLDAAIKENA